MRKERPLSELVKNERIIKPAITKEQVYDKLIMLAFNEVYDWIEGRSKKGIQDHVLEPIRRFGISNEYYNAMIDKACELYHTEIDNEYGQYFLAPPKIFEVSVKQGFINKKAIVSYTLGGKRFATDLQTKFKTEGIALQFIPYMPSEKGWTQVPIGVAFIPPSNYGLDYSAYYKIHYDPI